jgi:hypothetical protein
VAIAADGSLIAAVRLDEGGAPDRIDVLAREGEAWDIADVVPLDGMVRSAIVAWIRVP